MTDFKFKSFEVDLDPEEVGRFIDMMKPLSQRIHFHEMGLYNLTPEVLNFASELVTRGSVQNACIFDIKNDYLWDSQLIKSKYN